jgi:soluble lytic murein transglycosylase-like protein
MAPSDRFDSLFRCFAEWDRSPVTRRWERRPRPLDWTLLKRQAMADSGLDADAKSPVGALGLSQFMPATWAEWARTQQPTTLMLLDPRDPEDAIWAQADYLAWLLDAFQGDVRKALAGYNYGIGHVKRLVRELGDQWDTSLPDETRNYLVRILGT